VALYIIANIWYNAPSGGEEKMRGNTVTWVAIIGTLAGLILGPAWLQWTLGGAIIVLIVLVIVLVSRENINTGGHSR
jgi:hypothetical protein